VAAGINLCTKETEVMKPGPVTQAEIVEIFGDAIPLQAIQLVIDMPSNMTCDQLRGRLKAIARNKATEQPVVAGMLLSLQRRHLTAMREGNQQMQDRLANFVDEFEWAFPDYAEQLRRVFPAD
jgi:hypothetical protein